MKKYLYDPHVHTAETSKCGWMPASHVIDLYHDAGYTGVAITDHFYAGYFESLDCADDWDACVDRYLTGYRLAKARADKLDMEAILGIELRFLENGNDYLVYGIDEAFLRRNPYPYRLDAREFFRRFGSKVLIVQAHPYRGGNETVFHDCIHGVEVVNGNPRKKNRNEKALALAEKYPLLIRTCGSDTHRPGDEALCALALDRRARDSFQFKDALEYGAYTLESVLEPDIIAASNRALDCKR